MNYVHGHTPEESIRLVKQAKPLEKLFHEDLSFLPGQKVLEAGCGVGGQTVLLAQNWPDTEFVSIDIQESFIEHAKLRIQEANLKNVRFKHADIMALPFEKESFDHIYVCFVLEHLTDPLKALVNLKSVLKNGGSITIIEGDHDLFCCHPKYEDASRVVDCLTALQASHGGNALIGRQLYPLVKKAAFSRLSVTPKLMYVDASRPDLVEEFSKITFIGMIEEIKDQALAHNLINLEEWQKGIDALYRSTEADGTLCYTYFKAHAFK